MPALFRSPHSSPVKRDSQAEDGKTRKVNSEQEEKSGKGKGEQQIDMQGKAAGLIHTRMRPIGPVKARFQFNHIRPYCIDIRFNLFHKLFVRFILTLTLMVKT